MKKITLLFFALFAILWQSSGQVQVGNGTTTTTSLPLWSCWGYTYSQQIYYQSEVNAQGDITSLSFYYASGPNTNSLDWTIYMGHTTKTEFTSNTDWEPLASLTQVYTGTVTFPAAGNWMQITLDTPFSYNNVDNLIIALDENQAGFNCSVNWQKTDTPVNRGIAYRNDTTNPDPASPPTATSIFTYYPNVILDGIQQACPNPSALAAGNITPNSAELSWTENGTATTWNIEVVTAGTTPTGTATDVATTNPFVVTGLSPATDYEYYVQADCGLGEQSGWIGPFSFTTECTVFTAPYAEGFDTIGSIPNCWSQGASNSENWLFTSPTASHIGNVGNFGGTTTATGGGFAWVDDSTPDNLGTTLVSPLVDVSSLTSPTLSFYTISNNEGFTNVSFSVDFFDGAAWNIGIYTSNTNTNYWEEIFIDLSSYTITGPVQARFIVDENNTSGHFYDDRAIDDVSFDEAPSCFDPINVSVDSATDTTATISWTSGTGTTSNNIEVVTAGTTPTGTATDVATTSPYTIIGLSAATDYEFYIQADCGANGTSDWVGPFSFTTECTVFIAPYTEGFDTVGTIPNCWNQGASNGENWLFTSPTASHIGDAGDFGGTVTSSGGGFAWVDDSTPDNLGTTLVSPLVDVSTLASPTLSFYTISNNEGFTNVSFSVDFFDGAAWNIGIYTSNTNTNYWEEIFIDLSSYTITGPVQARFIVDENNTSGHFYDDRAIDDVSFDEAPSCFDPINVAFTNITDTTVEISWTDGPGATAWNVEIVPVGTPTGSPVVITTNPYSVTGLSAATEYQFYIQTDCGANGTSDWVGPYTFTTACGIVIPPYLQTFSTIPPHCWGVADDGDPTTGPQAIGTSAWVQDGFANNGTTGAYKINLWLASKSDWLLSPEFDLTGGPFQVELDLAVMVFGSSTTAGTLGSDDQVQLVITSDGGTTWTPLLTWDNTSAIPAGGEHYVHNLSAYSGSIVQFGIWASEGVVDDSNDNDVSVDNFEVRAVPTCPEPTGLTVSNFPPAGGVEVAWTENGSATTWNIEYGPAGFMPGTGTTVSGVVDNPYTGITGLTMDTSYDFYVQADCGPGDLSEWTGPSTVFVGYCQSVPTSNDGNGVANVQLNTAQFPSLGDVTYEDHTATVVNIFQGLNIPLFVTFETGFTYDTNVWIDFNDNLVFEASEIVFTGTSLNTNPTTLDCSFLLDAAAPLGIHRMRIGTADFGQSTPNPCYNGSWGVTLDFTVNIVELTCDLFEAEYTVVDDCANGDQFLIEVEITDMGSASTLTIANNIDANTVPVTGIGTYMAGPFPFQQNVYLSVSNDQDNNCTLLSPTYNLLGCPPANDDCVNSILATVNLDDNCTILNPGTILGASPSSEPAGSCTGSPNDDVWFHFVAENDTQIIQLLNISGTTTNLDFAVYDGTCGTFTEILCTGNTTEIVSNLTVGNTYYVRVFSGATGSYTTTFDLCIKYHGGVVTVTQDVDDFPTEQEWVEDLVQNVLLSSACAQVSNITYSTGTNFGSENGIGYFSTNSQTFPFANGVVLATADALDMTGPRGGPISGGNSTWTGDADLFNYIQGLGIDPGLSDYNNATILEFDFVPYNNQMSFDFLFASNEYGTFQCSYSDAFAFFLTDTNTGVTTNLALVPGTNDPISVITIRDNTYNTGCASVNDQYFDAYYGFGGEDPMIAPINLNGTTVQMTAQSAVTPYANYHIKLVIADRNDTAFDSAVFLSGGSFEIGEPDLGLDITIADGTATCYGNAVTLDTGYDGVPHTWYFEGFEIPGETGSTIDITEQGTYAVQLVYSPTCAPYDEILVEFLPLPEIVAEPIDVQSCDDSGTGTYDLTANNAGILGTQNPADFTITVHPTEQDAMDNTGEMASPYTGAPQTVYIRIENNVTGCYNIASFDLVFYPNPTFAQPGDLGGCDSDLDGFGEFFLTDQDALILNGQTGLTITYHASQDDADSGTAPLAVPYVALPGVVYVRIENDATGCYSTTSYNLVLNANPTVVTPDDMEACSDDDGYAVYDLESQTTVVTGGNTNYSVTYHDTTADAISGSNPLSSPYETMPPQTIYVRVVDVNTGCYTITDFDVIAFPYEDPSFDYGNISLLPCYETPAAVVYGAQGGIFSIDVNGDSNVSIDASTGQILNGASGASYVVTYTTTGPCPQSSSMTVDFEQCVFPQAISPNGDGMNDNFDLSSFDVQKLEIFNRYGALVYSKTDYTDEWHGQSDSGDELPVGTYYYVIRYQGGKEKAAWVYINK